MPPSCHWQTYSLSSCLLFILLCPPMVYDETSSQQLVKGFTISTFLCIFCIMAPLLIHCTVHEGIRVLTPRLRSAPVGCLLCALHPGGAHVRHMCQCTLACLPHVCTSVLHDKQSCSRFHVRHVPRRRLLLVAHGATCRLCGGASVQFSATVLNVCVQMSHYTVHGARCFSAVWGCQLAHELMPLVA